MTELPPESLNFQPQPIEDTVNAEDLLLQLRRKEGNWVEWGQACQQLQKSGHSPQAIFESSGFEPVHQNQVIVGAQVYVSMVNAGVAEETRSHFQRKGSDILYELRILTQAERAAAADYILSRNIDADGAKEVAKAIKEFSRYRTLPSGFTNHPGDAVAYQYWRLAKQQSDLQERSRWIARGLMFAHSQTARQQIEMLLTDLSNKSRKPAPNLPFYRLEAEEELPKITPVAGQLPLAVADFKQVPIFEETGTFKLVKYSGTQAWVALPGWQIVLNAEDPVAIIANTKQLPVNINTSPEEVLILIDRSQRQWDDNSYFAVDNSGQVEIQWFESTPSISLLGKLVLVLRPKRIFDESVNKDIWQIEE